MVGYQKWLAAIGVSSVAMAAAIGSAGARVQTGDVAAKDGGSLEMAAKDGGKLEELAAKDGGSFEMAR